MPLTAGSRVGPYEIVDWLGAGGMGDVYRARDARLDRDVAVKLIHASLATDSVRLRRFEDEARAAGQLNHPGILAVYDIGTEAGVPYIVSELLDGETLDSRLARGVLAPRKAADLARRIAEALAAAHARGIVHRDLKPANVFVLPDGRVKILDFGIAKLTRRSNHAPQPSGATETEPGAIIGTAGYMAPEQVRGETVDARSDLFGLGVILYEMLTGLQPFTRRTTVETMAAILNEEVPNLSTSAIPAPLAVVLERCLEKEREARFQSALDLAFALETASGHARAAVADGGAAARHPWHSRVAVGLLTLAVITGLGLWASRSRRPAAFINPLADATFDWLVLWPGSELSPQISPDGRFVVFLSDRAGELDLWWSQIGTTAPKNLTEDLPPLPASNILRTLGFSEDGAEVWFTPDAQRRVLVPQTGGVPRPFLGGRANAAAWSPDGQRLVYFDNAPGDPLYLADRSGGNAQPITITPTTDWLGTSATRLPGSNPEAVHNHNPVWSPDGEWIYFVHGLVRELNWTDDMDVWRVRPSGGLPERLTRHGSAVTFLAVLDANTLLYAARSERGAGPWLWALDIPSGRTSRATLGLEQYASVSASRDGRRLVAAVANPIVSLWSAPLSGLPDERHVVPYPGLDRQAFAPRLGEGSALYYLSPSSAGDQLWRVENGEPLEVLRGKEGALAGPPAVSRQGRLAATVRQGGRQHLAVMSSDGTDARALAPSIDVQGNADWSPDGQWLAVGGRDSAGPALFKISADGAGPPERLVDGPAANPVWSPTDDLIVYSGPVIAGKAPLMAVRTDRSHVNIGKVEVRPGSYRFLPNGTGLVFLPETNSPNFWLLDLATGASRPLTRLDRRGRLQGFDISADGKRIVFDRRNENANVVLIALPVK